MANFYVARRGSLPRARDKVALAIRIGLKKSSFLSNLNGDYRTVLKRKL